MNLSEQIRQAREAKGLSQEALAEQLGLSRQAVSKWELGASCPSPENLEALGNILEADFPGPLLLNPPELPKNGGSGSGDWSCSPVRCWLFCSRLRNLPPLLPPCASTMKPERSFIRTSATAGGPSRHRNREASL